SCSYCLRRTFFFSWSRAPRDLPSFPTRRSSDLVRPRVERRFQPRSRGREIEDDLMVSEEVGVVFGRRRCAGDERPRGRGPAFARGDESLEFSLDILAEPTDEGGQLSFQRQELAVRGQERSSEARVRLGGVRS